MQTRPLSERERRFVECYMGKAGGNATMAAIAAGYSKKSARFRGSKLATNVYIQAAMDARVKDDPSVADRQERQRFLSQVMRDPRVTMRDRLKASELLGKAQGDFVKRVEHLNVPPFRLILFDDSGRLPVDERDRMLMPHNQGNPIQ